MKILGLSSNYHDASAALVVNGEVRFAAAEERFSRRKHDPNYPVGAIRAALSSEGLSAADLDWVVYHEDPYNKLSRSLATSFARWPRSLKSFLLTGKDAATSSLRIHQEIASQLKIDPRKVVFTPHHMSHAALAFLTSPFQDAAVMTIDAVGEWTSSAIFRGKKDASGFSLKPVSVSPFPHSLGLFYSAITSYLGFRVNDGECSTMALAAFGTPAYLEPMRKIVRIKEDGSHFLDLSYLDFRSDTELPVSRKFLHIFGPPRSYRDRLPFDCLREGALPVDARARRFADIAASAQAVLQEAVLAYAKKAARETACGNLCYAGGVALNCVANEKLSASGVFQDVYIPADPGDGGAALGAALYFAALRGEYPGPGSPFVGAHFPAADLQAVLPHLTAVLWPKFSTLASRAGFDLRWRELEEDELLKAVAEKIHEGKIVGWMRGKFEQGPRALGARSILIRADREELARKLSTRVKKREAFRPYALSLTEKEARRVLGLEKIPWPARWMQTSLAVKEEFRASLRYGLHIDGGSRVQVVEEDSRFAGLLRHYGALSGVEAVINTSFNEAGSPLVASPLDALLMFARTEMDVLAVGRLLIEKREK